MINNDFILDNDKQMSLWCAPDAEPTDLAHAASRIIAHGGANISVVPDAVSVIWPWLENKNARILSRFYITKTDSDTMSDVVKNINTVFKHGADGAQLFMKFKDMSSVVSQMRQIRDDLFFNKSLFFGFDMRDIGPYSWGDVWAAIRDMRANGVLLAMPRDSGEKSDFVGRVYAALNAADDINCELHFYVASTRMEQVSRLVQAMRPDLMQQTQFFFNASARE